MIAKCGSESGHGEARLLPVSPALPLACPGPAVPLTPASANILKVAEADGAGDVLQRLLRHGLALGGRAFARPRPRRLHCRLWHLAAPAAHPAEVLCVSASVKAAAVFPSSFLGWAFFPSSFFFLYTRT